MATINNHIITALFLLVGVFSNAQNKNDASQAMFNTEALFLHVNTSTLVTGETLFYKIYCLNPVDNSVSQISKVAYIELIDSQRNSIVKQKLFLKNGIAQAAYFIPASLKTGSYKIVAHTNWMLNQITANAFQQDIFIINPFEELAEKYIAKETESYPLAKVSTRSTGSNSSASFKINLNKKSFKQREEAIISFNLDKPLPGNYSISVRKIDSLPILKQLTAVDFQNQTNKSEISADAKHLILPEMRGELVTGKIEAGDKNLQIQNIAVSLSIPGKSFVFKTVRTNNQGEFFFIIDQKYQNPEYIIQVIGEKNAQYSISLSKKKTVDVSNFTFKDLKINSKIKNSLEERSINSQIENAYFARKTDSLTALDQKYFYDPYSKSYRLDDYTRFSTLKQTVTEVVTEMSYTKSAGKYTFRLKDFNAQTQVQEPIIALIDGIHVQDVTDIAEYDAKNIEQINVVPKGYIYGGSVTSGIVSILTKNEDFDKTALSTKIFSYKFDAVPEQEKIYFKQRYDTQTKSSRIPDFRNQLLWLPHLTLIENSTRLSLFTSDISGSYEISIEGFTEKGNPISLTETFTVE